MPQIINTNISSLTAQRSLNQSQDSLNVSLARLSSGLRINSARDDAAGLAISNAFTSQIRGLNQAIRNANDGISLAQVAEGALAESTNILQRIRELSVQSANGTNSSSERTALQQEVSQLQAELTRIAETTRFGSRTLLDGSFGTEVFQVGANANETISVSVGNARANALGANTRDLGGTAFAANSIVVGDVGSNVVASTLDITGFVGSAQVPNSGTNGIVADSSARDIAGAINTVSSQTGVDADARTVVELDALSAAGTVTFTLEGEVGDSVSISANMTNTSDLSDLSDAINARSATTGITAAANGGSVVLTSENGDDIVISAFDVDAAGGGETLTLTRYDYNGVATAVTDNLIDGTDDAMTVVGNVRLDSSEAFTINGSDASLVATAATALGSSLASVDTINIGTQTGAQSALAIVDAAIGSIDSIRAGLGAVQNRLQSTISNLQSVSENVSAARSRIQDADFAAETANLTRGQILQQAGIAILAQANALPQQVLSLLQ